MGQAGRVVGYKQGGFLGQEEKGGTTRRNRETDRKGGWNKHVGIERQTGRVCGTNI